MKHAEDPVSLRAYARHRLEKKFKGTTHRAVQVAIATGRLVESVVIVGGKPKIIPSVADREWVENTDTLRSNAGGNPTTGRPGGSLDTPPKNDPRTDADREIAGRARRAQAERLEFQAKILELELRQLRGSLVEAEEAARIEHTIARTVRDRLRALPDRIAPMVAAETDPHRCRMLLVGEFDRVLAEMSKALRPKPPEAAA